MLKPINFGDPSLRHFEVCTKLYKTVVIYLSASNIKYCFSDCCRQILFLSLSTWLNSDTIASGIKASTFYWIKKSWKIKECMLNTHQGSCAREERFVLLWRRRSHGWGSREWSSHRTTRPHHSHSTANNNILSLVFWLKFR